MHILDQQAEIVHILTCDYENEMAGSEGQTQAISADLFTTNVN